MTLLNSTDLARALNVSKGRVSQYVGEGKLAGCYSGIGRLRRFDLDKAAAALGRVLDQGQMMGNGAETKRALAAIQSSPSRRAIEDDVDEDDAEDTTPPSRAVGRSSGQSQASPRDGGVLDGRDPDRYELARTQKAEEEARRLRRMNAEAEGNYVLASEVERQMQRILAQEIAEVEAVLRDGARRIADLMGVDFKAVRKLLMDQWRSHRASRTEALAKSAQVAVASAEEQAEDI